jgi:hypothetical protein
MSSFSYLRTRAFRKMVLEFLVIPMLIGISCAGLLILALIAVVSVTS